MKTVEAEFDKIIQTDRFVTNMMKSVETLNIVVQNMEKVMNDLQEEAKKEKDHLVPNINKIIEMLEKMIPQVYSQPEQKDKQMKEMKSAKESKKDAKEGEQMKKSLEITERTKPINWSTVGDSPKIRMDTNRGISKPPILENTDESTTPF